MSVVSTRIRKLNQLNQLMYEGNSSRKKLDWIQKQQAARCKKQEATKVIPPEKNENGYRNSKQQDAKSKKQQMFDQRPYLFVLVA